MLLRVGTTSRSPVWSPDETDLHAELIDNASAFGTRPSAFGLRHTAYDAACDEVCDAVCDEVCDEACDAVCDAACDAACDAVCDAAYDAAYLALALAEELSTTLVTLDRRLTTVPGTRCVVRVPTEARAGA